MREVGITFHIESRVCAHLNSRRKVPSGVLSVLPGPGATTGKELVSHPLIRKVDVTVGSCCANYLARQLKTAHIKAGTDTGRALGSIVGGNLAAFTAELGGKVIWRMVANPRRTN